MFGPGKKNSGEVFEEKVSSLYNHNDRENEEDDEKDVDQDKDGNQEE